MGLDTSHDCWHGAYSAFHRWRQKLAEVAGLPPLDLMEGFWRRPTDKEYGSGLSLSIRVSANTLDRASHGWSPQRADEDPTLRPGAMLLRAFDFPAIRWDCLKPDVLHELLYHSDCEGDLPAESCGPLADRLTELLPLLPDEDAGGHIGRWRPKTQAFIDGLRRAAAAGEPVWFASPPEPEEEEPTEGQPAERKP